MLPTHYTSLLLLLSSYFQILLLIGEGGIAVGGTAMVAETDVGGEGYGVVGMQLSLFILLGVWSERHIKPETAKTTREVSEQRQACGLVDYQPVAVERFQHPVYAVRR